MKNLLVPAAIAIGGLFVVNHLDKADMTNNACTLTGKHGTAKHHQHEKNNKVAIPVTEVQANTIRVAHFAPLTEVVASTFLIDFNDKQTQIADQEMNNQMEESLVEISLPEGKDADAEMIANFTAK